MLPGKGFGDDSNGFAWLAQGNESWCRMQRRNRAKVDGLGLLLGRLKPALRTRKFVWGPTKSDTHQIRIPGIPAYELTSHELTRVARSKG